MPNLDADYMEGLRLFYLKKYEESLPILTRAAEGGSAKAQHFLAMMYENGNGVERDFSKAAYWYEKTAEQGDLEAQLTYAMICALGKGMEADLAKACHWATVSYHRGNHKAAQTLQLIRSQAGGIAAESIEAFKTAHLAGDDEAAAAALQRAAECGNADAQYGYGQLLLTGSGVAEDRAAALLWFRDAAEQGHKEAAALLETLSGPAEEIDS